MEEFALLQAHSTPSGRLNQGSTLRRRRRTPESLLAVCTRTGGYFELLLRILATRKPMVLYA